MHISNNTNVLLLAWNSFDPVQQGIGSERLRTAPLVSPILQEEEMLCDNKNPGSATVIRSFLTARCSESQEHQQQQQQCEVGGSCRWAGHGGWDNSTGGATGNICTAHARTEKVIRKKKEKNYHNKRSTERKNKNGKHCTKIKQPLNPSKNKIGSG